MRKLNQRLIRELGGTEALWFLYLAIRRAWTDSAAYYDKHHLRDGHGLTAVRHDHTNRCLQDVCDRFPGWFPAFDYDRRRSRVFSLVERDGLTLSAAIVQSRAQWVEAAALRTDANRQTSIFNPPTIQRSRKDALVALLMISNGSPRRRFIRERPREIVVKYIVGDKQYAGEELNLEQMFASRYKEEVAASMPASASRTILPLQPQRRVTLPSDRPRIEVPRELLSKRRDVRIKESILHSMAPPSASDPQ